MLSEDIIRADGTVGPVGQRFEDALPAQSGSGPRTLALGPYTVGGGLAEDSPMHVATVDLGVGGHVIIFEITLDAIDYGVDAVDPTQGVGVDLYTSPDGIRFHENGNTSQIFFGQQPPGLDQDATGNLMTVDGILVVTRYIVPGFLWFADAPNGSATFSISVTTT